MNNRTNAKELDEKYKGFPSRTTVQVIDGCTYRVHSFFIGNKDLDETIRKLAFEAAYEETMRERTTQA